MKCYRSMVFLLIALTGVQVYTDGKRLYVSAQHGDKGCCELRLPSIYQSNVCSRSSMSRSARLSKPSSTWMSRSIGMNRSPDRSTGIGPAIHTPVMPRFDGNAILYIAAEEGDWIMNGGQAIKFGHTIIDPKGPKNPHVKAVGDINGDGFVDVVVASSNGGPLVWYEYPDWTRHVIAPSGRWSTDAQLADMDGDSDLDLIISEWYTHNRIEWYENPRREGNPATDPWKRHIIGRPRAHDIEVRDVDGDGHLEIVTRSQGKEGRRVVVWKRKNATSWTKRTIPCPSGEGLALGDMNGDGMLDVVIGGRWYEAPEDILRDPWEEHVFADWTSDAVVNVADMNRDGRPDVVLTRSEGSYRLSWFQAPPDPRSGGWTEHVVDDDVDFAHSLVICDINNDGEPDIVTAEMHQSPRKRVMVYLNEGDAARWERRVIAVTGSHNLCVADVGNTGTLDLIGANWSGGYQPVEMWRQIAHGER